MKTRNCLWLFLLFLSNSGFSEEQILDAWRSDAWLGRGFYVQFLIGTGEFDTGSSEERPLLLEDLHASSVGAELNLGFRTEYAWNFSLSSFGTELGGKSEVRRSVSHVTYYVGYRLFGREMVRCHAGPYVGTSTLTLSAPGLTDVEVKGTTFGLALFYDVQHRFYRRNRFLSSLTGFTTSLRLGLTNYEPGAAKAQKQDDLLAYGLEKTAAKVEVSHILLGMGVMLNGAF